MSDNQIKINEVLISFPYAPYQVQEKFMSKVLECLQNNTNGLLESPTGTGKTLALLCSSLAWLETKKAQVQALQMEAPIELREQLAQACGGSSNWGISLDAPRIIYSSRTHSQISQVVQELKQTRYKYMRAVVLGSRDQMCLHPEVSKQTSNAAKQRLCRAKISARTCPYHLNLENKVGAEPEYADASVLDIEDLVTLGRKHTCCPYYASRHLSGRTDILLVPYNYLLDPKSRRAHGLELKGNVVIFDEAHNVQSVCEEAMSTQLTSADLGLCITEVSQVLEELRAKEKMDLATSQMGDYSSSPPPDFSVNDLAVLKVMFSELEEQLDTALSNAISTQNFVKPASFLIEVLAKAELTASKKETVIGLLDKLVQYLTTIAGSSVWAAKGAGLQRFSDILITLFSKPTQHFCSKYKVYLESEKAQPKEGDVWVVKKSSSKKGWILNCWCLAPDLGIKELAEQGVASLILTSGTLSPLSTFAAELGVPFPVQLENPHIIKDKQVFIGVLGQGPDGTALSSSYNTRSDPGYLNSLGRTIVNFARHIPDGLLIFFPSYSMLRSCHTHWTQSGLWQNMASHKHAFLEPQGRDAFRQCLDDFQLKVDDPDDPRGAALFAVCRGKVSEGLDFSDQNARGVIIIGLPFAPIMDPRVKLKMGYLDEQFSKNKDALPGSQWYLQSAVRAVNQAIGRVIRHCQDYGAILLCDRRFAEQRIQDQLSKWVRERVHSYSNFGQSFKDLSHFFRNIEPGIKAHKKTSKSLAPVSNSSGIGAFGASEVSSSKRLPKKQSKDNTVSAANFKDEMTLKSGPTSFSAITTSAGFHYIRPSSDKRKAESIFDILEDEESSGLPRAGHPESKQPFLKTSPEAKKSRIGLDSLDCTVSSSSPLPTTSQPTTQASYVRIELKNGSKKVSQRGSPAMQRSLKDMFRSKEEDQRELWVHRLQEIKKCLTPVNKYEQFGSIIKLYKNTQDIPFLAEAMVQLFHSLPDKDNLLKKVSLLLQGSRREEFLQICKETSMPTPL